MSGIKVLNTTGSAPNKILANVCKAILEPDDRDEENVLRKELHHPFVEPNPALKQTLIDDFITSSVRCHSPQNPPNSTGLDIYENDDDDNEIIDQDDITTDGGFVPRMPKGWNTRFDKNEDNYAQTTTDGFITTRDSSNGAKDCMPPRVPWCGPGIDCGPDFVPWCAPGFTPRNSWT